MFCVGVLRRWQERYPDYATYHCLASALQHHTVGRKDLAAKYCGLHLGKDDLAVAKDYQYLLYIMSGYQCDKAVNKNDTREVI